MNNFDTAHIFSQALGLGETWKLESISFDESAKSLDMDIVYTGPRTLPCPTCGKDGAVVHDYRPLKWRHADFFEHKSYLHARVPRIRCSCGQKILEVPWARKGIHFTTAFVEIAIEFSRCMPVKRVAESLRMTDKKLWRLIDMYVSAGLASRDLSHVTSVGLDETSRKKGHTYVTIFVDLDTHTVLHVTPGKKGATVSEFKDVLIRHGGSVSQIQTMTCDMSPAFLSGITEHFPDARVTLDRFHIVKLISDALDATRRAERKLQPVLNGSRYALLRNPEKLNKREKKLVEEIVASNAQSGIAYSLKCAFNDFFYQSNKEDARNFLKGWISAVHESGLPLMKKAAKTIRKHWELILNWHSTYLSNAQLEAFNSNLQSAKSSDKGYRTFEYIANIAYLIGGKLPSVRCVMQKMTP
jgi:transposase